MLSAPEGERDEQSARKQRLGHGADHVDRHTRVTLSPLDRPHSPCTIPRTSLAYERVLVLPFAVLQVRAGLRGSDASKREDRPLVKDCADDFEGGKMRKVCYTRPITRVAFTADRTRQETRIDGQETSEGRELRSGRRRNEMIVPLFLGFEKNTRTRCSRGV